MQLSLAELGKCRRARRSPATIASRAGAASANGRARRLATILNAAGLKPTARYIAFHCADTLEQTLDGTGQYYETIDLVDAFHPQTILAYDMNDAPLPVAHGAPLRLRVERQLGYKMAKYVMRIEAIEIFAKIGPRQGRLLGGSRLRMVRGDLSDADVLSASRVVDGGGALDHDGGRW